MATQAQLRALAKARRAKKAKRGRGKATKPRKYKKRGGTRIGFAPKPHAKKRIMNKRGGKIKFNTKLKSSARAKLRNMLKGKGVSQKPAVSRLSFKF